MDNIKRFGLGLLIASISVIYASMSMDTTVFVPETGASVYNIGLMRTQSNILMIGGMMFIGGILILCLGKSTKPAEPKSEMTNNERIDEYYARSRNQD